MKLNCKNCQHWESKDRKKGYCNRIQDTENNMFWIEDITAYRPSLGTDKDFYCNQHIIHKDIHLAGSDV